MNDKSVKLYGHYISIPSCKVGLMLSMGGIPHSYHHVDLMKGEHKEPAFLGLNRFTQVPVIVHAGKTICQSDVILVYLAEQFTSLDGSTENERLRVREWLCWQADRLWNITRARSQIKFQNGAPAVVEQLQKASRDALGVLDAHLAGGEFIVGGSPTIADVACFTVVAYVADAEIDIAEWPAIIAWQARMAARDGCGNWDEIMPKESRA
ncbi:MAG: glutathione S-transferase family protein [Proteobacteria bacterium]|nr:glutathione S-transferase family protein [Pseudomonadota bacterium]MDA1355224.1 glutathione S-transferase family protein [Pseudomonadota bacterium]